MDAWQDFAGGQCRAVDGGSGWGSLLGPRQLAAMNVHNLA